MFFAVAIAASFSSCTAVNKSLREPGSYVQFEKKDFSLSEQVTGEAKSTRIFNIDFERLFTKKTGTVLGGSAALSIASIPVVGPILGGYLGDPTASYALYEMMAANPGYDVVFYPQFETKVERPIGLGFIYKKITVKTQARLGKLNK